MTLKKVCEIWCDRGNPCSPCLFRDCPHCLIVVDWDKSFKEFKDV